MSRNGIALVILAPIAFALPVANAQQAPNTDNWHPYVGVGASNTQAATFVSLPFGTNPGLVPMDRKVGGWTVFAGVRPNKYLGFELSLADLGTMHVAGSTSLVGATSFLNASSHSQALSAFAFAYAPIGDSTFDFFAKLGMSAVRTQRSSVVDLTGTGTCNLNPATNTCDPQGVVYTSAKSLSGAPTYGFGAQYRIGSIGLRADIQHTILSNLNPTTTSVALTYSW